VKFLKRERHTLDTLMQHQSGSSFRPFFVRRHSASFIPTPRRIDGK
jgi:hypothetical protein